MNLGFMAKERLRSLLLDGKIIFWTLTSRASVEVDRSTSGVEVARKETIGAERGVEGPDEQLARAHTLIATRQVVGKNLNVNIALIYEINPER